MVAAVQHPYALIRPMQPYDLDDVYANECLAYQFPWTRGIFADCIRVGYPCRVLELGDHVIGHAIVSCAAEEAHLLNICIQPAQQGRGYGKRLLHHSLHLVRNAGAASMFLEVRPSNWSAIRLYQAEGFAVIGRRPSYYRQTSDNDFAGQQAREDALVMSKSLI